MSEFGRLAQVAGWRIADYGRLRDGVWHLPTPAPMNFPAEAHNLLAAAEAASLWFAHRNQTLARALRRTGGLPPALWEVGAGNGWVAAFLQAHGVDVVAVEPDPGAARTAAQRGLREVVCGTFEQLALPVGVLSAAGCFDVLEHLADPRPLLAAIRRTLAPGGRLVLSVPALPWLWSPMDEMAGHFRRYRRAELVRLAAETGFAVRRLEYMGSTLVLPALLLRALPGRLGRPPATPADNLTTCVEQLAPSTPTVRALIRGVLKLEYAVRCLCPLPVGTSLVAVLAVPR